MEGGSRIPLSRSTGMNSELLINIKVQMVAVLRNHVILSSTKFELL